MKTRANRTATAALATLASCWTLSGAVDAQAPEEQLQPPAASPLAALRRNRDAYLGVREFVAALPPAEAVVRAQSEQREPDYPADLAALGLIQAELRNTEDALTNLIQAIGIVEDAEGETSVTLVEYYRGLGRTYIKSGQYQQAIVSLEQARHISQRNLGLFNVEQSPVLDDITTAYLGLGDTVEARNTQVERLENAVRRYGAADPRVIPYRYTLGKYYEQSRLPESAREQYQEVLKAHESRLGATNVELLTPLRELVALDLLVAQGSEPERRDRLAALLEQNEHAPAAERGLSLALLGDWAVVTGDPAAAHDYYRQAWLAFRANPELDPAGYFSKPVMIDFVPPLSPVDRNERSRPYTWAEIALEFDVSADGLPADVRIATRDPLTTSLQTRYSRRMRETHFRPRLVDGEPAATANVRSTHYVRRYVNKDEEEQAP
jgi:tetratricopeptide (TPR) repeat protein